MNCKNVQRLLPDYIEKTISEAEMALVRQHVQSCEGCRGELRLLEELYHARSSQSITEPPEHYWATLLPRIHQRIEERRHTPAFGWPRWVPRFALPGAIVVLVLVVITQVFLPDPSQRLPSSADNESLSAPGVREVVREFSESEIAELGDLSSVVPYYGFSAGEDGNSGGEQEILKELLSGEDSDLYSSIDYDVASEDLSSQEIEHILSQLQQKHFVR